MKKFLLNHSPPNRNAANIALKIVTLICTHIASLVTIVMAPNTIVTVEAMSGKTGRRRRTIRIVTMATTVDMMSAHVPAAMPYIALTTNINTSGPNSLTMLTVCSRLNGINRFNALMCLRSPSLLPIVVVGALGRLLPRAS